MEVLDFWMVCLLIISLVEKLGLVVLMARAEVLIMAAVAEVGSPQVFLTVIRLLEAVLTLAMADWMVAALAAVADFTGGDVAAGLVAAVDIPAVLAEMRTEQPAVAADHLISEPISKTWPE
jgi:hypothetical protein